MKLNHLKNALMFILSLATSSSGFGAAGPPLDKAKQEAEAGGYTFITSRDEIVARAKKEGRMRALSGLNPETIKPLAEAFKKKYPFLDVYVEEIEGTDAYQRFVLQMQAGTVKEWDAAFIPIDFYNDYAPHLKKFDILGMAKHGVLNINPEMIHPADRNALSASSVIQVVAYNRKLISEEKVPDKWEDFLKPEFKGKKFLTDIRPYAVASLVPAWGLEKTLDFARKLAAQDPIWARGASRLLTSMAAGEYALFMGPNYNSIMRAEARDKSGSLGHKIVEPVPTRTAARADAVLGTADHSYAALLWLEFHASAEGQRIIDQHTPFQGSIFTSGTETGRITRGKRLSVVDWNHFARLREYEEKVVEAYGFPKAKVK